MNVPVTLDPRVGEKVEASFGLPRAARSVFSARRLGRKDRLRRLLGLLQDNAEEFSKPPSARISAIAPRTKPASPKLSSSRPASSWRFDASIIG